MTRILNVLYDERLGGPQHRVIQVATELRREGLETHLAIPRGGPELVARLSAERIPYDQFSLVRPRQSLNPWLHLRYASLFWPNVAHLRSIIRRNRIKVVHTNGLMHLQAAFAAHLEKVGLVWHINDFVAPGPTKPFLVGLVRRWADRVAVASRAVGDFYFPGEDLDGRLEVVYAPVDVERFHPSVDGSSIRREFGLTERNPVIGTVGNLTPLKGTDILIRAIPAVREKFPDLRVLIVGEKLTTRTAYAKSLVCQCHDLGLSDTVIFTGHRKDIPELMATMDVCVQPSETEACGMAVLEASASGVPVVASRVGGMCETVADGQTGILVHDRAPESFSDAILSLLQSPATRRRMGEAGVRHCHAGFSLDHCVRRHLELYEPLINGAVAAPAAG